MNNTVKLKRILTDRHEMMYIVYPAGYDYGRGFSSLKLAFDFIRAFNNF